MFGENYHYEKQPKILVDGDCEVILDPLFETKVTKINDFFGKEGLDKIIRYVNKYNVEKKIGFYKTADYYEEGGFNIYQCLYPNPGFAEVDCFSKSDMLYLQLHGFIFEDEDEEIVDVRTLKE